MDIDKECIDVNKKCSEILKEYRCPVCNKLLCKGCLESKGSQLEVKCLRCGHVCLFSGEDAKLIQNKLELSK